MNQPVKQHIPILILVVMAFFAGCKENGDLMISGKLSNLNIVNATGDTLNAYQNGGRLNNLSTIGPGSQTGYTSITANSTSFEIKKAGQANYLIGSFAATLDTNTYYTLFICGETADKLFITKDTPPLLDSTSSANVRFVNASPSSTNVDVKIDKLSFSNIAFKTATAFRYDLVSLTTADTALVIVYPHGSTTPMISGKIPISVNTNYTIYLQGVPGGTGYNAPALGANIN